MAKMRVGIVFGGKSAEHEVSLQSAKNIVEAIDKTRFDVVLLGIDKQGLWHINDASNYLLNPQDPAHIALRPSDVTLAQIPGRDAHQLINADSGQPLAAIDVIFPIVHGTLGEDGSLQGMLRMANLPFVGSDVLGSAACMDKDVTKRLLCRYQSEAGATAVCEAREPGFFRRRQQSEDRRRVSAGHRVSL